MSELKLNWPPEETCNYVFREGPFMELKYNDDRKIESEKEEGLDK